MIRGRGADAIKRCPGSPSFICRDRVNFRIMATLSRPARAGSGFVT